MIKVGLVLVLGEQQKGASRQGVTRRIALSDACRRLPRSEHREKTRKTVLLRTDITTKEKHIPAVVLPVLPLAVVVRVQHQSSPHLVVAVGCDYYCQQPVARCCPLRHCL